MDNEKEIKKQIELLANGPPSYIVAEMETTSEQLKKTCDKFPFVKEDMRSHLRETGKKIKSTIKSALEIVSPLEQIESVIEKIEAKPGIQKYHILQKEMSNPTTKPSKVPGLRREIQSLKAAHSLEIQEMVSKSHEVLTYRLNLIQCWKTVTVIEIEFLEALQKSVLNSILDEAQSSGEKEAVEWIKEKLKSLKQKSKPQVSKMSGSLLQMSNVKVLKESIRHQLEEVVRLERTIKEKYKTLECISKVANEFESNLPEKPSIKNSASRFKPMARSAPPTQKAARMAFGRKNK